MRFTGSGVDGHPGSIPIGVIESTEIKTVDDTHHQIIATAALWNQEFPEEITWLKEAYAEGKAPGLSYEIFYKDFENQDNVQWLRDAFTGAATFVDNPAYGMRTALLALASSNLEKSQVEAGIIALAQQLVNETKGGNTMDEKELEALKSERDTLKAEAASKQSEIDNLNAKIADLEKSVTAKDAEIGSLKTAALLDSRIRQYTEAGFAFEAEAEKADKKKNLLASFTDEQFDEYLADLVAVKGAKTAAPAKTDDDKLPTPAVASVNGGVPRLEMDDDAFATLRQGMRSLARPNSIE